MVGSLSVELPLKTVLIIPFAIQIVGIVGLVAYLSYRSGQQAVEGLAYQLIKTKAEQVTQQLNTSLKTPHLINRLNIDATRRKILNLQNVGEIEEWLFTRLMQFETVSAVHFVNPQGLLRSVYREPSLTMAVGNPDQPSTIYNYSLDSNGRKSQILDTLPGFNIRRDRPWYQGAIHSGKPGWSEIFQQGASNLLVLNAAQPVYNPATKILEGVFAVHITLDQISHWLRTTEISDYSQVFIIERSGLLVATSTEEELVKEVEETPKNKKIRRRRVQESHSLLIQTTGNYLQEHFKDFTHVQKEQILKFRAKGEQKIVQITPFHDPYGLDWLIVVVVPEVEFLTEIQANMRHTFFLSLVALGMTVTIGSLTAHWISRPLQRLSQASQAIASGNLEQKIPEGLMIAELQLMSQSFNQMAEQLRQSFERLKSAFQESEEKFTRVFLSNPNPNFVLTWAEERILEVNQSYLNFFGYSRDALIGYTAGELRLWVYAQEHENFRKLLEAEGSIRNLEIALRTGSGEIKTLLISAERFTLEGQACVITQVTDITDRKALELALQASKNQLNDILNNTISSVVSFRVFANRDWDYEYQSAGSELLFGYKAEEIITDKTLWMSRVWPEDRETVILLYLNLF